MKIKMKLISTLFTTLTVMLYLFSTPSFSSGVSPYLPLKTDPVIELQIERLASLTKLPVLTKPYHVATVYSYLGKIKNSHPVLYTRITKYIKRFKKAASITHFNLSGQNSFDENHTVANSRGQNIDSTYQVSAAAFLQLNKYVIANVGGSYYENGDFIPNHSYLSFGVDWLQVDIGFREHWLSPHQDSALLLSTQAQPPLNITFSNPKPFKWLNTRYEMSVGLLEDTKDIQFEDGFTDGDVGFLTMHGSLQPLDFWTIGFNRTLMFGGGDRSISFGDVIDAITDPVGSDNCGGEESSCAAGEDVGNQQASITNKIDFSVYDFPMSFYHEYAGEDTKSYENTALGNIALNYGLFVPYLTETTSLNIEHANFMHAWYSHSIYGEGYTHQGNRMGHWWGDMKPGNETKGGASWSVRLNWEYSPDGQVEFLYRTAEVETDGRVTPQFDYERSHDLEVKINQAYKTYFITSKIQIGKTTFGDEFFQAGFSFRY